MSIVKCSIPTAPKPSNIKNALVFLGSYQARKLVRQDARDIAKWTKTQLQELGPTYVKLGQFISSRPDIFDAALITELKSLQDNVDPICFSAVQRIVSEQIGLDKFSYFSEEPIASASICQVHLATLASTGESVAIKVQRPYIREFFDRDFQTLSALFDVLSHLKLRSIQDSRLLLDQCYHYLYEELDFKNELANTNSFYSIVSNAYPGIIVPRPYASISTSKVLVMEYVPSTRIVMDENRPTMGVELMEFFLEQVVNYGIIHADPHPGNMGLTSDGRVVLYDYGQVSRLDPQLIQNIKPLLFAIYDRDVKDITDLLIKSQAIILQENADIVIIRGFIASVISYFEDLDFSKFTLSEDLALDPPFKINPQLILVFRSLSLLEGVCKSLDADFSYFKVIESVISKLFFDFDYIEHRIVKDTKRLLGTDEPEIKQPPPPKPVPDQSEVQNVKMMNTLSSFVLVNIALQVSQYPIENNFAKFVVITSIAVCFIVSSK